MHSLIFLSKISQKTKAINNLILTFVNKYAIIKHTSQKEETMYFEDQIYELLLYSSTVEEIQREGDKLAIAFHPHRNYLNQADLKVMLVPAVYSKGSKPRYNSKENIIFFADRNQMEKYSKDWGFSPIFFEAFLTEVYEEPAEETAFETIEISVYPVPYTEIPAKPAFILGDGGYQAQRLGLKSPDRPKCQRTVSQGFFF